MDSAIGQIVTFFVRSVTDWFQFLDNHSIGALVLLAVVCRLAANAPPAPYASMIPYAITGPVMLGYFLSRFADNCDDFSQLIGVLIRSFLSYGIVWCAVAIALAAISPVLPRIRRAASKVGRLFRKLLAAIEQRRAHRKAMRTAREYVPPPVTPRVPRAERLRQFAEDARADYEMEIHALTPLPLDDDEREVLALEAKQRLLQRLAKLPGG